VDDFPHWQLPLSSFETFHNLLSSMNAPYLLAVTPMLCRDPFDAHCTDTRPMTTDEIEVLHRVICQGGSIALHGLTHRTEPGLDFNSEFVGISADEAEERILKGIDLLTAVGLPKPRCFVPPFNTFDSALFPVLKRHFDLVNGGPESAWQAPGEEWVMNSPGGFVCCCSPMYGRATRILHQLLQLRREWFQGDWLTFHWSWEAEDSNRDLASLMKLLAHKTEKWEQRGP